MAGVRSRPAFAFTIGQFFLLLSTLVIAALHRHRHAEARMVGPVRSYLGTAISLVLPLGAVVWLTCVLLTGTTASLMSRTERENRRIIYEGQYNYYCAVYGDRVTQRGPAH